MIAAVIVIIVGPFCAITAYIVHTSAKAVTESGKVLSWWVNAVVWFWRVVGLPFDMLVNLTYASWRFKERPHELLLTKRLQRYRGYPDGDWRKKRAIDGWTWLNWFERAHW